MSASLTCALPGGKKKEVTHPSSLHHQRLCLQETPGCDPIWGIENWGRESLHLKFESLFLGTGNEHCDFGHSPVIFQYGIY